jgi:hypothetical protein
MKTKLIQLTLIIGVAALLATNVSAQSVTTITITTTTNASGGLTTTTNTTTGAVMPSASGFSWNGILEAGQSVFASLKGATNWAIAPYASIGVNNHKVGGGILALYDFNNFIGGGIGVDELGGNFSVVSGNLELKLPLRPLAFTGWAWATNFVATPFVYSGVGKPIGGTGTSGIVTHEGEGVNFDVIQLWGGEVSLGAAYIQRQGAGPVYSGNYFNPFFAWRKGF